MSSESHGIQMYSVNYTFRNAQYSVTDTEEVHLRLQSDEDFLSEYLANATTAPELVSVLDETTHSTCSDSEKKNFSWTNQATKLFLNSYLERKERFRNPKIKKKALWAEILQIMEANGYANLNEDLLDRKMRNMKKSYKNIKDNNKKSSTGRGRVKWEYLETFEDIFANDMTINCSSTISSMQRNEETTASECIADEPEVTTLIHLFSDSSNDPYPSPTSSPFQPIHPASVCSSSGVSSPLSNVTPSVLEGSEKSVRMSTLHNLRKKLIDVEERRIKAIMELKNSVDISNNIQQERNELLRNLLLLRTNRAAEENM